MLFGLDNLLGGIVTEIDFYSEDECALKAHIASSHTYLDD